MHRIARAVDARRARRTGCAYALRPDLAIAGGAALCFPAMADRLAPLVGYPGSFFLIAVEKHAVSKKMPLAVGKRAMIGDRAVVKQIVEQKVEVDYQGELWQAVSEVRLSPGQQVMILGIEDLQQ